MATDATGTPTPKGIPKYNTAVDPPSGRGFNAAMDAIDSLLDKCQYISGSPSLNQVPVWNGTAWVYGNPPVPPSNITQEGAQTNQILLWNGTQWTPSFLPLVSIQQGGATTSQFLKWSGTQWAPSTVPLTSIQQGGATTNQLLLWNGTQWVPSTVPLVSLNQGGATTNQLLLWNGTNWTPSTVPLASLRQDGAATNNLLKWDGTQWAPAYSITRIQDDFTEKGVQNSTVETSLFNTVPTIPGGVMGTFGTLHVFMYGRIRQGTTASLTWTYRVKVNGATIATGTSTGGATTEAAESNWVFHYIIRNRGATNSQICLTEKERNYSGVSRIPGQANPLYANGTIDTTANWTFNLTAQMSAAGANDYIYRTGVIVWVDPAGAIT